MNMLTLSMIKIPFLFWHKIKFSKLEDGV